MQRFDLPLRLPQLRGQGGRGAGFRSRWDGNRGRGSGLFGLVSGEPFAQGFFQAEPVLEPGLFFAQTPVEQFPGNVLPLGEREPGLFHLVAYGRTVELNPPPDRGMAHPKLLLHLPL